MLIRESNHSTGFTLEMMRWCQPQDSSLEQQLIYDVRNIKTTSFTGLATSECCLLHSTDFFFAAISASQHHGKWFD